MTMMTSSWLVLLMLPASATLAMDCGKAITTACLGDTDIRYDPDASDNILDQAEVWSKLNGYFQCDDGDAEGSVQGFDVVFNVTVFLNLTFAGSRFYRHSLSIAQELSTVFTSETFATSTYERDGSMLELGSIIGAETAAGGTEPGTAFVPATETENMRAFTPIDANSAFYATNASGDGTFHYEWNVFLDQDTFRMSHESFPVIIVDGQEQRTLDFKVSTTCRRSENVEAWNASLYSNYETYNVPEEIRYEPNDCLTESCPTEEQWCRQDPDCGDVTNKSPYQEPAASLTGGAIAGFTVLIVVVVVAILSGIYWYSLQAQEQRYKNAFARRVAANLEIRPSMKSMTLSPDALANEFRKIDSTSQNGKISKDTLWNFVQEGAVGEISKADFNALFAAMDTSGTGNVNFLEFCAFLNCCHDEFVEARRAAPASRDAQIKRMSRRISTNLSSRHLTVLKEDDPSAAMKNNDSTEPEEKDSGS